MKLLLALLLTASTAMAQNDPRLVLPDNGAGVVNLFSAGKKWASITSEGFFLTTPPQRPNCPTRINLKPVPATSRGGTIIYKSNWNVKENRENTIEEGNHSQKGAAILVQYRAKKYIRNSRTLEVRDLNCKPVALLGRYPRCTSQGCGEHERWYLRAPGGSYLTAQRLAERLGGSSFLVRLAGRQWAQVSNVFSDREIYP